MEHPEYCESYTSLRDRHVAPEQKIHSWWIKRLKKAIKNYGMIRPYPDLHEDFRYISGRFFTHLMIIRRSGMKKILDFEQRYGIFLPYDDELSVIPFLKMFNLKSSIVTKTLEEISDTLTD